MTPLGNILWTVHGTMQERIRIPGTARTPSTAIVTIQAIRCTVCITMVPRMAVGMVPAQVTAISKTISRGRITITTAGPTVTVGIIMAFVVTTKIIIRRLACRILRARLRVRLHARLRARLFARLRVRLRARLRVGERHHALAVPHHVGVITEDAVAAILVDTDSTIRTAHVVLVGVHMDTVAITVAWVTMATDRELTRAFTKPWSRRRGRINRLRTNKLQQRHNRVVTPPMMHQPLDGSHGIVVAAGSVAAGLWV